VASTFGPSRPFYKFVPNRTFEAGPTEGLAFLFSAPGKTRPDHVFILVYPQETPCSPKAPTFEERGRTGHTERGAIPFRLRCQPLAASPHLTNTLLRPKGACLAMCDKKQLRDELVRLIEKQIEMLAKESCDGLTEAELREYDDRKERIDQLYDALDHQDFAA
jgi:hypothetical protein